MFITRASTQALLAVAHLATRSAGEVRTFDQIAGSCGIPRRHLVKIFASLSRAGIVRSEQGRTGGFCLARSADRITMLDIVTIFDRQRRARSPLTLRAREHVTVRWTMRMIELNLRETAKILERRTFADMVSTT